MRAADVELLPKMQWEEEDEGGGGGGRENPQKLDRPLLLQQRSLVRAPGRWRPRRRHWRRRSEAFEGSE